MKDVKKYLLVGLGNPGAKYVNTRHNVGAAVVRAWVGDRAKWQMNKNGNAALAVLHESGVGITCLLPQSGMNESGAAVAAFMRSYPISAEDILIVHDDLELSLGEIDVRLGGSAKGHNGVRSVLQHCGEGNFPRLRLGIGRPPGNEVVRDYVLADFSAPELAALEKIKLAAGSAINLFLAN